LQKTVGRQVPAGTKRLEGGWARTEAVGRADPHSRGGGTPSSLQALAWGARPMSKQLSLGSLWPFFNVCRPEILGGPPTLNSPPAPRPASSAPRPASPAPRVPSQHPIFFPPHHDTTFPLSAPFLAPAAPIVDHAVTQARQNGRFNGCARDAALTPRHCRYLLPPPTPLFHMVRAP
jgi:hypothetical protein